MSHFKKLSLACFFMLMASNLLADTAKSPGTNDAILVHKPAIDPAWGKVIQYQQEIAVSPSEHTKETLHKFLFQDAQGVVRTAVYHESATGSGYWEVWVWDQP